LLFQTPASPVPKSPTTSIHLLCTPEGVPSSFQQILPRFIGRLTTYQRQACSSAQLLRYRATLPRASIRQVAVAQTAAIDLTPPQLPFLPPAESQKASLAVASLYHSKIAIACAKTTSLAERHYGALPSEKAEPACSTWGLSGV
jgi:hypothetical protein